MEGISEIIDFSTEKRIAAISAVSFDIFFVESIMPLLSGMTVVVADEEERHNPKLLAKLIADKHVNIIQMTPSGMYLLLNYDQEMICLNNVDVIMLGGEGLPPSMLHALQDKTTAQIYNMYGPVETTVWSSISNLTYKKTVDIGYPIKNTEIYIVDEYMNLLPYGKNGEICIAGEGVAKGYVGKGELTVEKFVYIPTHYEKRLYRTGDIGCYLPDGSIKYLGRSDNQVKIRGHRIEPEEIEEWINQFPGIIQSIVAVRETSEAHKVLQAFYTSEVSVEKKDIVNYLCTKLPTYMVPIIFKRIKTFKYTPNGKIDRKKVLECEEIPDEHVVLGEKYFSGISELQKKILEIIILNSERGFNNEISLDSDLAGIGIDSIGFVKLIIAFEEEFNRDFYEEMMEIASLPTIKSMLEYIEKKVSQNYCNIKKYECK